MYTQKLDWRQAAVIALIFALGIVLVMGKTPLPPGLAQMYGWVLLALGVLSAWEAAATRYEFTRNELVIHSGATRQRIRYDTIEAVRLAGGLLGWMTSPHTLRLLVGTRTSIGVVAVRPNNRDRFLDELTRAVPWLAVSQR